MVEWLLCKQHVAGSNPTTSTSLRQRFGWQAERSSISLKTQTEGFAIFFARTSIDFRGCFMIKYAT